MNYCVSENKYGRYLLKTLKSIFFLSSLSIPFLVL